MKLPFSSLATPPGSHINIGSIMGSVVISNKILMVGLAFLGIFISLYIKQGTLTHYMT